MVSLRPAGTSRGGRRSTIRWSPRENSKISFEAPPLTTWVSIGSPAPPPPLPPPPRAGRGRRAPRSSPRRPPTETARRSQSPPPRAGGARHPPPPPPPPLGQVRGREQALIRLVLLQHLPGDRHLV